MAPATRPDEGGIFGEMKNSTFSEDPSFVGPGGRSHDKNSFGNKTLNNLDTKVITTGYNGIKEYLEFA